MERFLNIGHYCFYLILNKLHLFTNKINLAYLIFKIPYFKNKHKKENFDPVQVQNKLWMNKENGLNVWGAAGALGSLLFGIFLSLFLIFTKGQDVGNHQLLVSVVLIIIVGLIILKYIYKKDVYLKYFREFESWSKIEKTRYLTLCIIGVLGVAVLFFVSLKYHFSP